MCAAVIAKNLASTITLNDGVMMPMFGLGTYRLTTGAGGESETVTSFALQHGYRLLDTAVYYGNELEVGRGIVMSGIKREEVSVLCNCFGVLVKFIGFNHIDSKFIPKIAIINTNKTTISIQGVY